MKKAKDEDLDKLFKSGLDNPGNEPVYREADWEAMEQFLDKGKKRPAIIILLPWLSVAAALILVILGWLLFRPQVAPGNNKNGNDMAALKNKKENTGTSSGGTRLKAADSSSKQIVRTPANYATNPVHHGEAKNTKRSYPYQPVTPAANLPANGDGNLAANKANAVKDKKELNTVDANPTSSNVVAVNPASTSPDKKDLGTGDANPANSNIVAANLTSTSPDKKDLGTGEAKKDQPDAKGIASNQSKVKRTRTSTPAVYAVTAIGSSDMNGVSGMQGSRVGGNLGGLFSVSFSKWTFSTGVMYSIKPYEESYENYHTSYVFQTNPSSIGVNCKMLDIPLNVNYQVYKNHSDRFTVGTGLSSYIILREDYSFNYSNPYTYGPSGYSVINKNRNILSIVNLDATYDHQINSKMGISFQPYVKLPFSNVGESQAKLQSAGVAVGISYNLNSFKKPN